MVADVIRATAGCDGALPMVEYALETRGRSTPSASPARCGSCGAPGPAAAVAGRRRPLPRDWLPHADWVELDGVGHCPQVDVPLETAQLILGFTR